MGYVVLPGAQKSASTSLYRLLETHPAICSSPKKEPHFFSKTSVYRPDAAYYVAREFGHCIPNGETHFFEGSQSYLTVADVPERIRATLGDDVRFIVVLRHPVDRAASAFSHFRAKPKGEVVRTIHDITPHDLHSVNLEQLLAWEEDAVQASLEKGEIVGRDPEWSTVGYPFRYFYNGVYSMHITRFFGLFPREQFLFLTFEDVTRRQQTTMERVAAFLGLDASSMTADYTHENKTRRYRNDKLGATVRGIKKRVRPLKRYLPGGLLEGVRRLEVSWLMDRERASFGQEVRARLERIFAPEIARTAALTGLNLSAWTKSTGMVSSDR